MQIQVFEDDVSIAETQSESSGITRFYCQAMMEILKEPLHTFKTKRDPTGAKGPNSRSQKSCLKFILRRAILSIQASQVGMCTDTYSQILESLINQKTDRIMSKVALEFQESLQLGEAAEKSQQRFLQTKWASRLLILYRAFHPVARLFHFNLFTPRVMRVATLHMNLLGSIAFAALYYNAGALSRDSNPSLCRDDRNTAGSRIAIAAGVALYSGLFAGIAMLVFRFLQGGLLERHAESEGDEELQLHAAKRNLKTILFWAFSFIYTGLSCFVICGFLAHASESSVNNWTLSLCISVFLDYVLRSFLWALFFSIYSSVMMIYSPFVTDETMKSLRIATVVTCIRLTVIPSLASVKTVETIDFHENLAPNDESSSDYQVSAYRFKSNLAPEVEHSFHSVLPGTPFQT